MLNATEKYRKAAKSDSQYARIKVEAGSFGVTQDATGTVSATFTEDDVVECTVSNTIGEGGSFGIGSTESSECRLQLLTDSAKPILGDVTSYDYRVSFGYDLDDGTTEWLVMGVFATDRSLVEKSGMYTNLTLYDAMYWLDRIAFSGVSAARGTSAPVASMLADVCEQADIELASDTSVPNVSYSMMRPRTDSGATVRSAIGDIAAMCFCNATAYDGKLHLVKLPDPKTATPTDTLTPDDFRDVPSFDFAESCVSALTGSVTESSGYSSSKPADMVRPACKLVLARDKHVKLFGASNKNKKRNDRYILYVYRSDDVKKKAAKAGQAVGIADTDSPSSLPWATVKATNGKYKGKSILDIYKAGGILGVYVTSGISAVGRRAFDLDRYGKKVCMPGKNTKWFPTYSENGKSYHGSFSDSVTTFRGDSFKNKANQQKDWSKISEWRGDDEEQSMSFTGGTPDFSWGDNSSSYEDPDGNAIELAPELFADGGTVNTLYDDSSLDMIEADFRMLCSLATIPYTYVGSTTSMFGRNCYSVGDLLKVTDVYGDTYSVPVMNATYTYGGGILTELGCDGADTDNGASSYGGSASTSSKADANTGKLDNVKSDVDDKINSIVGKADSAEKLASEAKKSAEEAIAKADSLDDLSYLIQVDSLAAGQAASDAYDSVHPIVEGMRNAISQVEEQANQIEGVKESASKTVEIVTSLAKAQATYSYETEKSVVRWRQTYTEQVDAWASEDPDTQAEIKKAYEKLYGENGTPENPTADSAQGRLNSAKAANIEAVATESEMKTKLAEAQAYQSACNSQVKADEAAYKKALANYKALKKKTTAKKKQIDAAATALNSKKAKRDESQAKVNEANVRCSEAEQNYADAKAALATAEAKVEAASAEVDTAMNGIHELYSSTIEQTAKGIKLTAEKTEAQEKKLGQLEVTAESINSDVKTLDSKTGALMKATNMTQTDSGWTWSIVDNTARNKADSAASDAADAANDAAEAKSTANSAYNMSYNIINGTGTLTLGGSATAINMGGSTTSITMGPAEISSEYVSELGISIMSITPSNATGYSGLYLHSDGGLRVGSSSDIEGGVVACGSVMSKGDIWATSGDVRTSGVYASSSVYAGGALTTSLSSASVATGKAAVGTGTGGSNHGLWSDALDKWMIYSNGSTVTCNSSSSRFVKENISDVPDEEAAKLLGIRTVTYDYKKGNPGDKGWIGVIAEEVYGTIPRAVIQPEKPYEDLAGMIERGEDTSELGIDYSTFTPYLIKLCQMQQKQIDALEKRVSALEGVDSDTSPSCD